MIAVGLMSGTSADGVDAAAIEIEVPATSVRLIFTMSEPYPKRVREAVLALGEGGVTDARELARLHGLLGDRYADLAARVCADLGTKPAVITVQGQTVAHLPDERVTLQIGDAARVATLTGVPVVADLRSADVAAGGQGAPLVPFADHILFASLAPVAVLNLGGIANLTVIPTPHADDVVAFDTGPGNMVIDGVAGAIGATHDLNGGGAKRGRVDKETLSELLAHPYFAQRAPKSTGRELFGALVAERLLELVIKHGGTHDDALATATALTAQSIADALSRETSGGRAPARLLIAGGGTRNTTLVAMLRAAVAPMPVEETDDHGVPSAYREAAAFAILGAYRLRGLPNTLPRATGARRAVSAGALHIA